MLKGVEGFSELAQKLDLNFWIIFLINSALFLVMVIALLYITCKYRSSKVKKEDIGTLEHHTGLEITWTVIPIILVMIIFYFAYEGLKLAREVPKNNLFTVTAVGMKWKWLHKYPNGKKTEDLYVPVGTNIKVNLRAPINDVLHSYYVPAFKIKQDVEPGSKVNYVWFNTNKTGEYVIQCAEYCGLKHYDMIANIVVLKKDEFDNWYNSDKKTPFSKEETKELSVEEAKDKLAMEILDENSCTACHSLDTKDILAGPSLKEIFGKEVKIKEKGKLKTIIRDEEYIKKAILDPDSELVHDYEAGMMPSYEGVIDEKQVQILIDFFKRKENKK